MASDHYVSRSEAIRAAITDHSHRLNGESEEVIKLLHEKIDSQSADINELSDTIESLLKLIVGPKLTLNSHGHGRSLNDIPTKQVGEANVVSENRIATAEIKIDEEVYESISKLGQATISEVSDYCGNAQLETSKSLERLDARGLISSSTRGRVTEYQVKTDVPKGRKKAEETDE
ncbi:hypothetical protein [Haloferax sp. YSSS75]|uniref:hypothetical protein n=1 Tax=Haloferax sp. YSSS75 TaxID=3388564 RepID=UPI00398C83CA